MGKYFGKLRDSSKTDNGIDAFSMERTAFEEISFAMENVNVSRDAAGNPTQSSVTYTSPSITGSDLIVFYSVQYY